MADKYVPPALCTGTWHLQDDAGDCGQTTSKLAEQYAAEALEIAGAPINVFKLLGVHEQGKLIDLTGYGVAISNGSSSLCPPSEAFTTPSNGWKSIQTGLAVLQEPAYIGYDFGNKTVNGIINPNARIPQYQNGAPVVQHITTLRIKQAVDPLTRANQIRIDRGEGSLIPGGMTSSHISNGLYISNIALSDKVQINEIFTISTVDGINFIVVSSIIGTVGTTTVNKAFRAARIAFVLNAPSPLPSDITSSITFTAMVMWKRVDVVNLPNTNVVETISIRPSAASRYWRIVPVMFNGVSSNSRWEIDRLELMNYEATSIDNVQDWLLQENRDRDYSTQSITLRCSYTPTDSLGDLSKFGLSILDQYVFECSFAKMVENLGRPIVVGDILEVQPELAYDHNLNPIKKYLEVTDAGWSANGFTPGWKPILYRFQGQQLLPSQEHRDIIGLPNTQLYTIDDGSFFNNVASVNTAATTASEMISVAALTKVPETGTDITQEIPLEEVTQITTPTPTFIPISAKESLYVEDGLPPGGIEYTESYGTLPSISPPPADGAYHRINYPPEMKIPSRLYKFSLLKNSWIYVETDRRMENTSYSQGIQELLTSNTRKSIKG